MRQHAIFCRAQQGLEQAAYTGHPRVKASGYHSETMPARLTYRAFVVTPSQPRAIATINLPALIFACCSSETVMAGPEPHVFLNARGKVLFA